jgi:hypothetical protein
MIAVFGGCRLSAPEGDDATDTALLLGAPGESLVVNEDLTPHQIFPRDNWWHVDVSKAPLADNGEEYILWIGPSVTLHPDFGPSPYGLPYLSVSGNQPLVPVTFTQYGSESDAGAPGQPPGYPIPDEAFQLPGLIEGGDAGGGTSGDRHLIIIDRDKGFLFETWHTHYDTTLQRWEAGSGAVFNLWTNDRRPLGWTSADAAGLAILPGLVRYEDLYGPDEIDHAFRVTFRGSNGYVWPASHRAGQNQSAPPLGARLRLRAGFDDSGYTAPMQKFIRALKKYGLIFADNGSDLFIQGTMDARWDDGFLNPAFDSIRADDFEMIEFGWTPSRVANGGTKANIED